MSKLISVIAVMLVTLSAGAQNLQQDAAALFKTLSPEQKQQAFRRFNNPQRNEQKFTPGKRFGIQIKDLEPTQQEMAVGLIKDFTSSYGFEKSKQIAAQNKPPGFGEYYVAFFGNPGIDKEYAWRIAEHHLTLVDVEVKDGKASIFGPILLGANPPVLLGDEEDAMILLYSSLTPEEREKLTQKGRSDSSAKFSVQTLKVSELNAEAQKRVREVYEGRLKFFNKDIQARVNNLVEEKGGIGAMQIAFWGEALKRCSQGGRWDFKLAGDDFLCDYENTRGHIHMSLSANLGDKSGT